MLKKMVEFERLLGVMCDIFVTCGSRNLLGGVGGRVFSPSGSQAQPAIQRKKSRKT